MKQLLFSKDFSGSIRQTAAATSRTRRAHARPAAARCRTAIARPRRLEARRRRRLGWLAGSPVVGSGAVGFSRDKRAPQARVTGSGAGHGAQGCVESASAAAAAACAEGGALSSKCPPWLEMDMSTGGMKMNQMPNVVVLIPSRTYSWTPCPASPRPAHTCFAAR